jgi:WD40 repeat protein
MPRTILILSSTPRDMAPLRVIEEAREIEEAIRRSRYRDAYQVVLRLGVRARDLHRLLLEYRPAILHFAGHGYGGQGLVLEDDRGDSLPVSSSHLAEMLGQFGHEIECVVLNACHSEAQLAEIARRIPAVIGMKESLDDRAAVVFAMSFYDSLADGKSIHSAFGVACSAVSVNGLALDRIAVLAITDTGAVSLSASEVPKGAEPDSIPETLPPAASARPGRLWEVPELPPHYLARPVDIEQLEGALLAPGARTVGITAVSQNCSSGPDKHGLHGMGGIGKSVLAAAIARQPAIRERFSDGIFWIALGQMPQLALLQAQLCRAFGHVEAFDSISEGTQRLRELAAERAILLILDDVWDAAHAQSLDVVGRDGRILVTTRDLEVLTWLDACEHCLDVLDPAQARSLLADWTQLANDALPPAAAEVARACGYLPLALAMIGALVRRGRVWTELQTWLDEAQLVRIQGKVPAYPYRNVLQAIEASVSALEHGMARQCYIDLAVFPEDTPIPRSALRLLWSRHGLRTADADALADTLSDRALARRDEADRMMLHDLQRLYARSQVEDLAALHGALADAYLARRGLADDGRDSHYAGLDDGYFFQRLPWHLVEARRHDDLAALLFDFDWLDAKLRATSPAALLTDFAFVAPQHSVHREAMLVRDAVLLASHVLADDPGQLSSQLVGRLVGEHPKRGELLSLQKEEQYEHVRSLLGFELTQRSGFEHKYLHLRRLLHLEHARLGQLLAQVRADTRQPWLCPLTQTLTPAGGPLVRTFAGHTETVVAVAVLPDGKHALSASRDKTLKLWDLDTGAVLRTLEGHSDAVTAVRVLPGGKRILSASEDKTLKLWDLDTGTVLRTFEGHSGSLTDVVVLPSGKQALSASVDVTLKLWDLDTGTVLRTFEVPVPSKGELMAWFRDTEGVRRPSHVVTAVAVLPGGKHALCASHIGLNLWELDTGAVLGTLEGRLSTMTAVVVLPGGKQALSASVDGTLKLWDLDTDTLLRAFKGHSNAVIAVTVLPDGKHALSASEDKTLKLWDLGTGAVLRTVEGHSDAVTAVTVLPGGNHVLSASRDKTLKLWNLGTGAVPRTFEGHSGAVTAVTVLPDEKHAMSSSRDGTRKLWDLDTGAVLRTLEGRQDRRRILGLADFTFPSAREGHSDYVRDVRLLPDGKHVLSASADKTLKLWDLDTRTVLRTFEGHSDAVITVTVLPDGKHALSASADKTLKLWDLGTGAVLRTFEGHSDGVTAVKVLPGGKRILSASRDGGRKLWDLDTGTVLRTFEGHSGWLPPVAMLPSGKHILFLSNTIELWNLDTGTVLLTLEGHSDHVTAAAVVPGGNLALSTSRDNTLKLWDLHAGDAIATFTGDYPMNACAFSSDARTVVAGDDGGHVHILRVIWPAGPGRNTRKLDRGV